MKKAEPPFAAAFDRQAAALPLPSMCRIPSSTGLCRLCFLDN